MHSECDSLPIIVAYTLVGGSKLGWHVPGRPFGDESQTIGNSVLHICNPTLNPFYQPVKRPMFICLMS